MVEWFKAAVLKTAEGQLSEGSNPSSSAIFFAKMRDSLNEMKAIPWKHFCQKMAEWRRKSSLHCFLQLAAFAAIAKALHSKNKVFSSHLHQIPEALLVKSLPLVACEDVSLTLHLWSCRLSAGWCVSFYCASLTRRQAALIFIFAMLY